MKKIIFLLFVLLVCTNLSQAQAPPYAFSSSSGTYTEMTAGATLLPLVAADDYISPAQSIGFTFNYAGVNYTQFLMSSNGFISFNTVGTANLAANDFSAANATSRPIIAPLWDDLDGAGPLTSVAGYQVTGVAPNRILTVEWRNWEWNWQSNTPVISFQAKLYETTNVIQFVYRQEPTAVNSGSASIGIGTATGSGAGTYLNLTTDPFPSVSSTVSVTNIATKPANGQTYTFTPTTCLPPIGLVSSNILQNSATVTWTADVPAATGYEYVVQSSLATALGAGIPTTTNTVSVTGRLANTQYNVYLRKACGTAFSSWVLAGTFTTLCNLQTEFVETFDTYTSTGAAFYVDCWGKSNMTGTANLTTGGIAPGSAPNRLLFSNTATTTAVAVLPSVSNLQANTNRLVFKSYATVASRTIDIGYLTNAADFTSFVVVQNLPLASTLDSSATTQTVVPTGIPAGITSLAFRLTGLATTAYLDDVKWEPNTTCVEPTALVATGITTTTAQIDWTEPAVPAANGYDFFRSTSPTAPLSTATPTGSVGAGLNSTILSGLAPSTLYYVWVRSRCSATNRSPWSAGITFLTNCSDATTFSQNFDAALTFPTCWKKLGTGGTGAISATAAVSAPNSLSLNSSGVTVATQGLVIMPPVSNAGAGTHRLTFRARATSTVGGVIQVGYVTDNFDGNTFVPLQSFTTTSTTVFDSFSAILGTDPGPNKFLAFRHAGVPANAVLIDNVVWEPIPSCIDPAALASSMVTNNSATISWTEPLVPAGLGYQYFVSTSNIAPSAASAATGSVGAGISTINITALAPQTTYFVWVRGVCTASDRSAWTPSITFTTACNPIATLPWSENFDTTATGTNIFPPCWGFENILSTWFILTTPSPAFSGANLLRRTWSTDGWAFTPTMTLTAATSYEFSYWTRANDTTAPGYSIDTAVGQSQTAAAMTTVLDAKTGYVNAVWTRVTVNFTPTTTGIYTFGVRAGVPTSAPNGINFDDFRVQLSPSCIEPTNVVRGVVTSTTAVVSWTAPVVAPANGYQYFISTTNVAPSAASVATGSTAAGVTTFTFTGLLPATTYFVWIRSACSASDRSAWAPAVSFITACVPLTTLPWTENFDTTLTGTNIFPPCWDFINILNTWSISTTPTAYSGANSLRRTWDTEGWAFTPSVILTSGTSYTFSYWMRTNDAIVGYGVRATVGQGQTAAAMTTELGSQTAYQGPAWTKFSYQYVPTSTAAFSFGIYVNGPNPPNGINFDDFKIEVTPTCINPTALVASAITTSAATVAWTAPTTAPANGYEYFLSTTNVAPSAASAATAAIAAGVTTINLTGLNSATNYFVWVRSICSASDKSEWSAVSNFTTLCVALTTFTQNFDAATTFPLCWSKVGTPGTANIQTTSAFSPSNCLYMFGSSTTAQPVVAMPAVSNAGAGTHWLKFKMRANFTAAGVLQVGYLTNPTDITSFVSVLSFTTNSATVYQDIVANLGTAPGANQVLAFRSLGVPANSILVDDVSWEALPTCASPTALVASAITTSAATVAWTAPTALPINGYEYFLSTTNTAPLATATPTGSTAAGVTTINLTPLLSATTYFIWVRSVCSASSSSSWSTALSFATACATASTPYTENFDSATVPNLPNCSTALNAGTGNNWAVAFSPGFGFTSNTLRYGYNSTNAANAWFFTRAINLTAGVQYKLNYRYGNNSTTYVEKMKVAYGTAATVVGMTNPLADHTAINSGAPVTAPQVTFTPATTGVYFFGFNAYSIADQFDLYVDDIVIDTVLSNNTFDNSSFSYYPNPVKGILTLDYNQNISNVAVFNLLGQQVITKTVNANQSKIDMSNLSAGTYLVKVTADNQTKTIKVIKE